MRVYRLVKAQRTPQTDGEHMARQTNLAALPCRRVDLLTELQPRLPKLGPSSGYTPRFLCRATCTKPMTLLILASAHMQAHAVRYAFPCCLESSRAV